MALLVHVANIILTWNDSKLCTNFKAYLDKYFHIKDLGNLKYFLGIQVTKNSKGLFLGIKFVFSLACTLSPRVCMSVCI